MTGEVLRGEQVRLRPVEVADGPRFAEILAQPAVARWWVGDDPVAVTDQVRELLAPGPETTTFAVEVAAADPPGPPAVVGFIQCSEETDPQYRHAGIDVALDPPWHGRGLGTDAVRTLARHLVADRGHHRLTIDPSVANEIAVRTYRRVGFRPVGVMRRYERAPDGTWRDGLLMDLLADEITLTPDLLTLDL